MVDGLVGFMIALLMDPKRQDSAAPRRLRGVGEARGGVEGGGAPPAGEEERRGRRRRMRRAVLTVLSVILALASMVAIGLGKMGEPSRPVQALVGAAAGVPAVEALVEGSRLAPLGAAAPNRFDSGWAVRRVAGGDGAALVPLHGKGRLLVVHLGEETERVLELDLAAPGLPAGEPVSVRTGERELARSVAGAAVLPLRLRLPADLPVGQVPLDVLFGAAALSPATGDGPEAAADEKGAPGAVAAGTKGGGAAPGAKGAEAATGAKGVGAAAETKGAAGAATAGARGAGAMVGATGVAAAPGAAATGAKGAGAVAERGEEAAGGVERGEAAGGVARDRGVPGAKGVAAAPDATGMKTAAVAKGTARAAAPGEKGVGAVTGGKRADAAGGGKTGETAAGATGVNAVAGAGPAGAKGATAGGPGVIGGSLEPALAAGWARVEGTAVVQAGNCLVYVPVELHGNDAVVGTFVPPAGALAGQRFDLSVERLDGTPIRRFHWVPSFWNRLRGSRRFELPLRGTKGTVRLRLISRAAAGGGPPGRWQGLGLIDVRGEILTPGQGQ